MFTNLKPDFTVSIYTTLYSTLFSRIRQKRKYKVITYIHAETADIVYS